MCWAASNLRPQWLGRAVFNSCLHSTRAAVTGLKLAQLHVPFHPGSRADRATPVRPHALLVGGKSKKARATPHFTLKSA